MTALADRTAPTDAPVLDVVGDRWSTRIFDPAATIDEGALASALEAARWASSEFNSQPWRFLVVRRGSAAHAKVLDTLVPFNRSWAEPAAALVVFVAETQDADGKARTHAAYDTGQAASFFALQAHAGGLHTHQLSGFDADALHAAFELPASLRPLTVVAVGPLGDPAQASEKVLAKENAPRTRRPLADSVLIDD